MDAICKIDRNKRSAELLPPYSDSRFPEKNDKRVKNLEGLKKAQNVAHMSGMSGYRERSKKRGREKKE